MSSVAPLPSLFQMPAAQGGLIGDLTAVPAGGAPAAGEEAMSFFGLVSEEAAAAQPALQAAPVAEQPAKTADAAPLVPALAPERAAGTVDLAALLATTEALDQGGDAASVPVATETADPVQLGSAPPVTFEPAKAPVAEQAPALEPAQTSASLQALLDLLQASPVSETPTVAAAAKPAPVTTDVPAVAELADDTAPVAAPEEDAALAMTPAIVDPAVMAVAAPLQMPVAPVRVAPVTLPAEGVRNVDGPSAADATPVARPSLPFVPEAAPASVIGPSDDVLPVDAAPVEHVPVAAAPVVPERLNVALETAAPPAAEPAPVEALPELAAPQAAQAADQAEAVAPVKADSFMAVSRSSDLPAQDQRKSVDAPVVAAEMVTQADRTVPAAKDIGAESSVPVVKVPVAEASIPAVKTPVLSLETPAVPQAEIPTAAAPVTVSSVQPDVTPAVARPADLTVEAPSIPVQVAVDALKAVPAVEQITVTVPTEVAPVVAAHAPAVEAQAADGTAPAAAKAKAPAETAVVVPQIDSGDSAAPAAVAPVVTTADQPLAAAASVATPAVSVAAAVSAPVVGTPPVAKDKSTLSSARPDAPAVAQAPLPSAKVAVARLAVDGDFQLALDILPEVAVTVTQTPVEEPAVLPPVAVAVQRAPAVAAPVSPAAVAAPAEGAAPVLPASDLAAQLDVSPVAKAPVAVEIAPLAGKSPETSSASKAVPQVPNPQPAVIVPMPVAVTTADVVDQPVPAVVEASATPVLDEAPATAAPTPIASSAQPQAPRATVTQSPNPAPSSDPSTNPTLSAPVVAVANAAAQGQQGSVDQANAEVATAVAAVSIPAAAAPMRPSSERRSSDATSQTVSDGATASSGGAATTSAFGLAERKTVSGISNAAKAFVERLRQGTQEPQVSEKGGDTGVTNLTGLTGGQQTANAPTAPATAEAGGAGFTRAVPIAHVGAEIARQASTGATSFSVRLHPEELGRIDVKLDFGSDGSARAHLTVERADTLDTLSRDQRQIEQTLRDAGFSTRDGSVSLSLRQDGGGDRPNQGQWNQQQGENRPRYYADAASNEVDASVSVPADVYRGRRDALVDMKV